MNGQRRKYITVLVSLFYLWTTLSIELGHTDIIDTSYGTVHRLLSHDCNSKEVHHPLGKDDQCPACARIVQTTAYIGSVLFLPKPSFETISALTALDSISLPDRTISLVRGPPMLLV